jgi:response regulator RpfG family c-di-GMP phosphodiesterase
MKAQAVAPGFEAIGYTVLLVDDEQNILAALRRLFRADGYQLKFAGSGAEALSILDREAVDLVISDMRMPEMMGDELLAQVAARWPDVPRILLTGYADVASTISAINRGHIYCYIAKPWEEDDLRLKVRGALELRRLQRERDRLAALTQAQNEQLAALNATLEQRVRERTSELEQTVQMYELACEEMKVSCLAAVNVVARLTELHAGARRGESERVAELARGLAQKLGLGSEAAEHVYHAALLRDIGKIGLPERLLNTHPAKLSEPDRAAFQDYPARGASLIVSVEPFAPAAPMLRHQRERFDGSGYPGGLAGGRIPFGARILAVANDFYALQADRGESKAQALARLQALAGTHYDPQVVDALALSTGAAPAAGQEEAGRGIPLSQVKPGMVLTHDLVSPDGILLVTRGHRLSQGLIDMLRSLDKNPNQPLLIQARAG